MAVSRVLIRQPNVVEGLSARPEVLPPSEPGLGDGDVVFLGTGSAVPSKYRNVTGIYVRLDKGGMLLDCGEGSFHQLRSLYSRAELKQGPPIVYFRAGPWMLEEG